MHINPIELSRLVKWPVPSKVPEVFHPQNAESPWYHPTVSSNYAMLIIMSLGCHIIFETLLKLSTPVIATSKIAWFSCLMSFLYLLICQQYSFGQ
jgi:hypothetical protein